MAPWHLGTKNMSQNIWRVHGGGLLPTSIVGTEHILAWKLKSLGNPPLQLIAVVGQWEGKIYIPLPLLGHGASVKWEEGMG